MSRKENPLTTLYNESGCDRFEPGSSEHRAALAKFREGTRALILSQYGSDRQRAQEPAFRSTNRPFKERSIMTNEVANFFNTPAGKATLDALQAAQFKANRSYEAMMECVKKDPQYYGALALEMIGGGTGVTPITWAGRAVMTLVVMREALDHHAHGKSFSEMSLTDYSKVIADVGAITFLHRKGHHLTHAFITEPMATTVTHAAVGSQEHDISHATAASIDTVVKVLTLQRKQFSEFYEKHGYYPMLLGESGIQNAPGVNEYPGKVPFSGLLGSPMYENPPPAGSESAIEPAGSDALRALGKGMKKAHEGVEKHNEGGYQSLMEGSPAASRAPTPEDSPRRVNPSFLMSREELGQQQTQWAWKTLDERYPRKKSTSSSSGEGRFDLTITSEEYPDYEAITEHAIRDLEMQLDKVVEMVSLAKTQEKASQAVLAEKNWVKALSERDKVDRTTLDYFKRAEQIYYSGFAVDDEIYLLRAWKEGKFTSLISRLRGLSDLESTRLKSIKAHRSTDGMADVVMDTVDASYERGMRYAFGRWSDFFTSLGADLSMIRLDKAHQHHYRSSQYLEELKKRLLTPDELWRPDSGDVRWAFERHTQNAVQLCSVDMKLAGEALTEVVKKITADKRAPKSLRMLLWHSNNAYRTACQCLTDEETMAKYDKLVEAVDAARPSLEAAQLDPEMPEYFKRDIGELIDYARYYQACDRQAQEKQKALLKDTAYEDFDEPLPNPDEKNGPNEYPRPFEDGAVAPTMRQRHILDRGKRTSPDEEAASDEETATSSVVVTVIADEEHEAEKAERMAAEIAVAEAKAAAEAERDALAAAEAEKHALIAKEALAYRDRIFKKEATIEVIEAVSHGLSQVQAAMRIEGETARIKGAASLRQMDSQAKRRGTTHEIKRHIAQQHTLWRTRGPSVDESSAAALKVLYQRRRVKY